MAGSSERPSVLVATTMFGIVPCILGVGIGLYLRWSGTVWLTSAGGFWPIVCLSISIALMVKRAVSPFSDRVASVSAWIMIAWTWLYFPLWLTAIEIPRTSGVISKQGRVFVASEWTRQPTDILWLLTGRTGNRLVQNVTGTLNVASIDVQYRYDETYVATRNDKEDLSEPLLTASNAILTVEAGKPRSSRIALFERREALERLQDRICRAAVHTSVACPVKLKLSPQIDATTPGSLWSKDYTENEAVRERHLPALIQLLTQDRLQLVDGDRVFALFMEIAVAVEDLAKVARRPRMLSERQFDDLIKRILILPGGGDDALSIVTEVGRVKQDQRQGLRTKIFREARLELIVKHIAALRISDAEVAELSARLRATFEANPDIATLALEHFGERMPLEAQYDAVRAIVDAKASYAIGALAYVNFSERLREQILAKVLTDASCDDFDAARASRDGLENALTPEEMRRLIASAVTKSESSTKWLDFAVQKLPIHSMTLGERRAVLNGLLFVSHKSALEFVSENRNYLEAVDVDEVTRDYTRTIAPDLCLHLSHRNKNRKINYFSETQLQIFRDCAQSK